MTLTQEARDFLAGEWVEGDEEGFKAGFGYKLKEGAPQEAQEMFEEIKSLFVD